MKGTKPETEVIGRKEWAVFPDLQFGPVEAKIDTGAYTTALHCNDLRLINEDGKIILTFKMLEPEHPDYEKQVQKFEHFSVKTIKNSFGDSEKRYIIKTRIRMGKRKLITTLSLTDRGGMRYPVLIGRKLLRNRFTVNVAEEFMLPQPSLRKLKKRI